MLRRSIHICIDSLLVDCPNTEQSSTDYVVLAGQTVVTVGVLLSTVVVVVVVVVVVELTTVTLVIGVEVSVVVTVVVVVLEGMAPAKVMSGGLKPRSRR